jgi:predicted NUDIX family NTP pyrophosphohydrolase
MTRNVAAGLLMCRKTPEALSFLLVHPGGPYFRNKEAGVWTIPKGLPEAGEDLAETARREFFEETGIRPIPPFHDLGTVKQKSGKVVYAWAFLGAWDPVTGITCNEFTIEWPPRSGKRTSFPEVDKAEWMDFETAKKSILPEQIAFLERAAEIFKG